MMPAIDAPSRTRIELGPLTETLFPHLYPEWVIHDDEALVAIDKPAGLAWQPQRERDLSDVRARIAAWLTARGEDASGLRLVHALDREASGIVVLGKTPAANAALSEAFARGVERSYLAIVAGTRLPHAPDCRIEALDKRDGRMLCRLSSRARSQPVRRWLESAGAPIAGDLGARGEAAPRLMLHGESLRLIHPTSGVDLFLSTRPPEALRRWLERGPEALALDTGIGERLARAVAKRYAIARRGDTDALRLVNAEGDELPGIELDLYGAYAVLALRSPEALALREALLDAVLALGVSGVHLKERPRKSSDIGAADRARLAPPQALRGASAPALATVREAGLDFEVRLGDGFSTGLFLDQRANRERVRAWSAGRRVLNLFGYTGAFSVAAAAGGARASVTVDSAKAALERAAQNLEACGADLAHHRLVHDDALRFLQRSQRYKERFDLVILDPPSFSTTRRATFRAEDDYQELAALALGVAAPRATLLACTNHRGIVPRRFRRMIERAAERAGRRLDGIEPLSDPVDFPPPPGQPCHLKSLRVKLAG
jgi:23S rRNA (cytosine1962-C5)-methyltransferase